MEPKKIVIVVVVLVIIAGLFYFFSPRIHPTALIAGVIGAQSPVQSQLYSAIDRMFEGKPQSFTQEADFYGLQFPAGTAIKFNRDPYSTQQDVLVLVNASNVQIQNANQFPQMTINQFTFVPFETIQDPYMKTLYPQGYYVMPVNVS